MPVTRVARICDFIAKRRTGRGLKPGTTVSPATINEELRHLRAVLRKAHKWGYLPVMPDIDFEREARKLPTYVTPEDFGTIYAACDKHARWPDVYPFPAADWWRGLLMLGYLTGWRIGQMQSNDQFD